MKPVYDISNEHPEYAVAIHQDPDDLGRFKWCVQHKRFDSIEGNAARKEGVAITLENAQFAAAEALAQLPKTGKIFSAGGVEVL